MPGRAAQSHRGQFRECYGQQAGSGVTIALVFPESRFSVSAALRVCGLKERSYGERGCDSNLSLLHNRGERI
jgi:hypothetical protein